MVAKATGTAEPEAPRRRGRPPRVSAEDIVRAATPLFALNGYRGTTVAAIAKAVGITDGGVLHYFDTKMAILDAVLAVDDEPARREFLRLLEPGGIESLERLSNWGARMEAHPDTTSLQVVLSAEALSATSELHDRYELRYQFIRGALQSMFQRGIDDGSIRKDVDPEHEAIALFSFLDGLRLQWFYANGDFSLEEHVTAYIDHLIERVATRRRRKR